MKSLRLPLLVALLASPGAFAKTCPNIMLVVDQSTSMAEDPNGNNPPMGSSKWNLAQQAVVNLVNMYGDRVPFGLEMFYSDAWMNNQACFDATMIQVEPAHDNSTQIVQLIKAASPPDGVHTNTGEAIKRAASDPVMADTTRKNYIILITDGVPSCNTDDLMGLAFNGTPDYTISEINNARNQNPTVHTWVIGFDGSGTGVDKDALSMMALSGGEPYGSHTGTGEMMCGNMTPCYYSASDANTFTKAIGSVIDIITGGEFGGQLCDDSCYSNGCQAGYVCVKSELDPVAKCVPDPCQGAQCSGDQFCRMGQCVKACTSGCKAGQKCVNGDCVTDQCWGVNCPMGMACNPNNGMCIDDLCMGKTCTPPTTCDVVTGKCIDDQCHIITCPQGTTCQAGGNCSAATNSDRGKGCAVAVAAPPSEKLPAGITFGALALLGLALRLRRRRS